MLRLVGIAAFDLHDGAQRPFQPEAIFARKGSAPLRERVKGEQFEFGRGKQARVSGQHDAQQRRARARRSKNKDSGWILRGSRDLQGSNQSSHLREHRLIDRSRHGRGDGRYIARRTLS